MKKLILLSTLLIWGILGAISDMDIRQNKFTDEEILNLVKTQPEYLNKNINAGNGVLQYALHYKHFDLAKKLVEAGADINRPANNHDTPIMYACLYGEKALYDWFLSKGASTGDPNSFENWILNYAVTGGNIEIADDLLKKGFDVNKIVRGGAAPLHRAIMVQKREMVAYLLEKGADVNLRMTNEYNNSPLELAIFKNDRPIIELIIKKRPNLIEKNKYGSTPFSQALEANDIHLLELMFQNGYQLDTSMKEQEESPLHRATMVSPYLVEFLLSKGANINKRNNNGETALMFSLYADSLNSFNTLLKQHADIHNKDHYGKNALFSAVTMGKTEAVRTLLNLKSDASVTDQRGMTPLHVAALNGNGEITQMLIDYQVDLQAKDKKGLTPYQYAYQYNNQKVAELIKKADKKQKKVTIQFADQFLKNSKKDEMKIYSTGHSGWLLNFDDTWFVFDYFPGVPQPDQSCLDNGYISSDFLKDKKVFVFVSHEHGDHFSRAVTEWQKINPGIQYFFGFNPNADQTFQNRPFPLPQYTKLSADSTYQLKDLEISTFKSPIDGGIGFVVKYNGKTILHPGDALYMENDWPNAYTRSLDKLKAKYMNIDLAFIPITGCGFNNMESLEKSNNYLIQTFSPKVMIPMHGLGHEQDYTQFKETYGKKYPDKKIMIFEYKGDHQKLKL